MKAFKEKTFGDKKTIKDDYTEKELHRDHKAAKNKYKSKASEHQSETDHKVALKHIHDSAKNMKYINDDDIKNAANREHNFKEISKKQNASKGEKTNYDAAKDNDELTAKGKAKMIADGVVAEARINAELLTKDLSRAGLEGMKSGAMAAGSSAVASNIAAFVKGEKDLSEATIDTLVDTTKGVASAGVANVAVEATSVAVRGAADKLAQKTAETAITKALSETALKSLEYLGNNVGKVFFVAKGVGSALKRYAEGEIDGADFLLEIGQSGSDLIMSTIGATVGSALIPVPVVGAFIGSVVGHLISSVLYSTALEIFQGNKLVRERALEMQRLYEAARKEMRRQREEFEANVGMFLKRRDVALNNAFEKMSAAWKNDDINGYISGLDVLAREFGGELQFKTFEEFDEFMSDDSAVFEF